METISNWSMYYRSRNERRPGQASRRYSIDGDESRRGSLVSTVSGKESDCSSITERSTHLAHRRHSSHGEIKMDLSQSSDDTVCTDSLCKFNWPIQLPPYEFQYCHGRRYLKDAIYPLPSDMAELQRQSLCTLLTSTVLGAPTCIPINPLNLPKDVLELGCGGAFWSASCHDFFSSLDVPNPSFTGLDVVPLAPDLRDQGIDWTFVQHDLRRPHLPFLDESFDLVVMKDINLTMKRDSELWKRLLRDTIRILRPGGYIEVQAMDLFIRTILPNPQTPSYMTMHDAIVVRNTGTHAVSTSTSFGACQNRYLNDFNKWVQVAMAQSDLNYTPGTNVHAALVEEIDMLDDVGYKRVAIPFATSLDWEIPGNGLKRRQVSAEQTSIRQTALQTITQWMEALEPILRETSGKDDEEWSVWWGSMMENLTEPQNCAAGECLEIGSWWARKKPA